MASSSLVGTTSTVTGDVGGDDPGAAVSRRVARRVDRDAQRLQARQRIAAHGGIVLADPGGERDDVGRPRAPRR